jgi:diguanylate cyclase (GGDEF)-like protein
MRMRRLHLTGERLPRLEQKHLRLDGSVLDVELASAEIEYGGNKVALVIARDISARKRDQERQAQLVAKLQQTVDRLDRLSRIRTVLSSINGAILRIRDQQTLLDEVCRIAVEEGRLLLAWVMMIDASGAYLEFKSHAGVGRECFEGLRIPLSPHRDGDIGPTREAVLIGDAVVWDNVQDDASRRQWQERARTLGYRSAIALPLRVEGVIVGAFTFCAEENGFFTEEQKRLLLELAADAGLGLDYMRRVAEVERLAYFDPLTGLAKPSLVEDRLRQSLARARRNGRLVAAVVVNVVQLREFNLRFGRGVTDVVIRAVGDEISRSLRSGDTVGRLDAFDFIVVLVDIASTEDIPVVVRKTYSSIPRALRIGADELPVRVRLGVAAFPRDGETSEELIRNASIASTRASPTEGEDIVFYSAGAGSH